MPLQKAVNYSLGQSLFSCFILGIYFIFCSFTVQGQVVKIHEDPAISRLMEKFVEVNKNNKTTSGWRIQITSSTDRREAEEVMGRFSEIHPDIVLSWVHAKPYYQVRVGAFRTKMESLRLMARLKEDFPDAYPVFDKNIKQSEIAGIKN